MSQGGIYDAFDAYLATMPGLPQLIREGEPSTPSAGRPYAASRMSAYVRRPAAMGPRPLYIESGTFQVTIYRPALEGRGAATAAADRVVAFFPRNHSLTTADGRVVLFLSASAQPLMGQDAFLAVPVTVQWQTSSLQVP